MSDNEQEVPKGKPSELRKIVIAIAIVLFGFWLAGKVLDGAIGLVANSVTITGGSDSSSASSSYAPSEQPQDKAKVLDWSWARSTAGGNVVSYAVSGKVKNLTGEPLGWVDLEAMIYDKKGEVCTGTSIVYAQNVPPYGTAAIQGHISIYGGRPTTATLRVSDVR